MTNAAKNERTITCTEPGCPSPEIKVTGNASDALYLGLHKKRVHGIAGKHASRKPPKRAAPAPRGLDDDERPTPLSVVHDASDELQSRRTSAPNADDLTRAFGVAYGRLSLMAWSSVIATDERFRSEEERAEQVEQIAPTAGECAATVAPVARLVSKLELNKKYGRVIVENLEVLDTAYAVMEQIRRASGYMRERRAFERGEAVGDVTVLRSAPASNGSPFTSPPPQEGRVLSYEDLHPDQRHGAVTPEAAPEM